MDAVPTPCGVEAAQPSEPQRPVGVLRPPRPSCSGTSQVFRGLWPFEPQSKGFYAAGNRLGMVILRPSQRLSSCAS